MGYRTIVAGTDGSATAGRAVDKAARLAKITGARLVLVSAVPAEAPSDEEAQRVLREAQASVRRRGVKAEILSPEGRPGDVLPQVAASTAADLIVVGSVGMGKVRRFSLGGVAEQAAHNAPCDVLIVRTEREDEGPPRKLVYKGLVVGTDGSPTASEAVRKAFDLGMVLETKITVVYVAGDPLIGAIVLEKAKAAKPDWVPVETRLVKEGEPAGAIAQLAESGVADLIVVGNKGMAGARRFALTSVPVHLAHKAARDVLIAKTTDRSLEDLSPGHGGLVMVEGKKLAVYIEENGTHHFLSPRCQHMGCTVDWNGGDQSWDCPCHGSRYRFDGKVFHGPAKRDLDAADINPQRYSG
ncbi:MAG TPA: universal stress protein [Actinomycetota bacterium]|nr:universal stress protein [Actinomycetota bacterium]